MLLKNKVAVIYGAGGAIGGAVARAFAQDGAKLFLTGHGRASMEAVAEMDAEKFFLPIANYTRSYFLTARLAARCMIQNKSGVIMTVTALTSRKGNTGAGGYGPSQAAKEALTRRAPRYPRGRPADECHTGDRHV